MLRNSKRNTVYILPLCVSDSQLDFNFLQRFASAYLSTRVAVMHPWSLHSNPPELAKQPNAPTTPKKYSKMKLKDKSYRSGFLDLRNPDHPQKSWKLPFRVCKDGNRQLLADKICSMLAELVPHDGENTNLFLTKKNIRNLRCGNNNG